MKYDFESIIDRRGQDAWAIDGLGTWPGMSPDEPKEGFDFIPMWVADMNFATAPTVVEAMKKRLEHPLFGYFAMRDEYFDSIINWHNVRYQTEGLYAEAIGYENGVLGGLVAALNALGKPGDSVLLHSPTYIGFTNSITAAGYNIVLSPLVQDEDGIYRMDLADMEEKIKEHHIKMAVFCNPHNPTGRVWTQEEMVAAMDVYSKYDCKVIADEIWADLTLENHTFLPFEIVNECAKENTIAIYAPSKTFNLAGLVGSYHIIYNEQLKQMVEVSSAKTHYNDANVLSMHALIGAYSEEGMVWVDELKEVLSQNVNYAYEYIQQNFADFIDVSKPEGTYMLLLDCEKWCRKNEKSMEQLLKAGWDVGIGWQDGRPFHQEYGIRLNLALPLSRVKEAFDRMKKYVF